MKTNAMTGRHTKMKARENRRIGEITRVYTGIKSESLTVLPMNYFSTRHSGVDSAKTPL